MASPSIPVSDTLVHSDTDDESQAAFSSRCCHWMPCMQSHRPPVDFRSNWWEQITDNGKETDHRRWWSKGLMAFKKIREWSELVAGPKWKTFIRRFRKKRCKQTKFQYDPASYSLNFDEGQAHTEDKDLYFRDFSSRYASIPISTKTSMDLGKDDLSFTCGSCS